ncbi:MAG: tRNA dihydrouridine synthase [Desulfocapsaceae bacterium]
MNSSPDTCLYMAPLKGITDSLFRQVYSRHFPGIDWAVAPFVNPQNTPRYPDKLIADLLPEKNSGLPLIPQALNTDAEGFVALGDRLYDLGYEELNWNLGCPVKMVAGKRRGSGLLPHPDKIIDLLEQILPKLKPALSIKMRLGYQSHREALALLPRLDPFPLTEIIIHARLGIQLYRGQVNLDHFELCREKTSHQLVYNGDLVTLEDFTSLSNRFEPIDRWMIGRGLLINPFLPTEIKGIYLSRNERKEKLQLFQDDLYHGLKERLSGPGHLLGRMKQMWIYYIHAFPGKEKLLKKITRASSEKSFLKAIDAVLER